MKLFKKPNSMFYWYDFTVRGRRYRGSTHETKSIRAQKTASLKLASVIENTDLLPSKPTNLGKFDERFLAWVDESRLEEKTKKFYRNGWRLLKATTVSDTRLEQITGDCAEQLKFPGSAANANCALRTLAAAAVLLFAVGGWLWVRGRRSVEATDTAVLDLRERSVARGQSESGTGQASLQISRAAKHLFLDLPIGSKEGPYDVGLFTETGDQILLAAVTAQLQNHITNLRVDVELSSVRPGPYALGVRQPSLEWTRYPIRVF